MSKKSKTGPIEVLVQKRIEQLIYIQRVHRQEVFYGNVIRLSKADIGNYVNEDVQTKRTEMFFSLGMNLSPLLSAKPENFLSNCTQLIEEYEYHYSNFAMQGMKYLRFLTMDHEPLKKVGNTIIFEYLKSITLPCKLDYFQVLHSLCDILIFVYRKFMEDPNPKESTRQLIYALDDKIKSNTIGLLYKELTAMSIQLTKTKVSYLDITKK
jgi:hypothetical protein